MQSKIAKIDPGREFFAEPERCWITETWNTPDDEVVSIARAVVKPGVTTAWHALDGVSERYIVVSGRGRMEVGDLPPTAVEPGDTVFIPAGVRQRITNTGSSELVFYCLCNPRFYPECYRALE